MKVEDAARRFSGTIEEHRGLLMYLGEMSYAWERELRSQRNQHNR